MSLPTLTPQQAGGVDREHRALRVLIDSIAERFAAEAQEAETLGQDLPGLVGKLAEHFASEEASGGLYAQVLDQDARFAPEIARLTEEHTVLLETARSLTDGAMPWSDKQACFQQLRQALELHESDENRLLQQAYTDEIGSKD